MGLHGRGTGVERARGIGLDRGVGVGIGVAVAVTVAVGVGVDVGVDVADAVGVGVGVGVVADSGEAAQISIVATSRDHVAVRQGRGPDRCQTRERLPQQSAVGEYPPSRRG